MGLADFIAWSFIPLGIFCLYRPVLIVYLFVTYPVLQFIPTLTQKDGFFEIVRVGSVQVYLNDYLYLILFLTLLTTVIKTMVNNRSLLDATLASPVTKIVFALFIWNLFIGFLSYSKGFKIQNVVRGISPEYSILLVILLPLLNDVEGKKHRFYSYCVFLALLLALFAVLRYYVTNQFIYTSSFTKRTLLDYTIPIFILPLCYVLFYGEAWRRRNILYWTVIFACILGVSLSAFRSGWLTLFFALGYYFLSPSFDRSRYLWIPLLSIAFCFSILFLFPILEKHLKSSIFGEAIVRIAATTQMENKTTQERLDKWAFSWEVMKSEPLLGLGRIPLGSTTVDMRTNRHLKDFSEFNRKAHNLFASKIAHEGILGLTILLLFFYFLYREIAKLKQIDRNYAHFILCYMLSYLLLCMFNPTFNHSPCKNIYFAMIGFFNADLINYNLASLQSEFEAAYQDTKIEGLA